MKDELNHIFITSFYQPGSILLKFEGNILSLKNLPFHILRKKVLLEIYDQSENVVFDKVLHYSSNIEGLTLPIKKSGIYFLRVYIQEKFCGNYKGMLFKNDVPFYLSNSGNFRFIETIVAAPNREFLTKMPNPSTVQCFQERVKITRLAKKIVSSTKGTYERILLIHDWIADNIYYDFDALQHIGDPAICITKPVDVVESRRTICQGYTDLAVALMRSIGIPAVGIVCFSLGLGSIGGWERKENLNAESNHIFPAAYCDSRWLFMDVTWDSGNEYRNGKFIKSEEPVSRKYFDITTRFLSNTHKLISIQE